MAMRRQDQYGDPPSNAYVPAPMHNISTLETKSGNFEGQLEAFTPERQNPNANSKPAVQWKWELVESNISSSMASGMHKEGQGSVASRSYFQGQRQDPKLVLQNQSNNDAKSQVSQVPREDMKVGYEVNHLPQTFEGLEKMFLDEITKLAKEQNTAEDAEIARHREAINAIGAQYQEKLAALRAQHASRREEFLRRESEARQVQYQQSIRGPYPTTGMAPRGPHGHTAAGNFSASATVGQMPRGYSPYGFNPNPERARFLGGGRGQGFGPIRGPYDPRGRVYDAGPHYYN